MIQAVIFDVDGVLLDTVPYHFKAWKQLFASLGVPFSFTDYLTKVNGLPRVEGVKNMFPTKENVWLEEMAEKKQTFLQQMIETKPPIPLPGVLPFLHQLKKKGILMAAASSSKNAPVLLQQTSLTKFLSVIISGRDITKPKPDPQLFLLASTQLGISPENCLVIEDASIGIQAAKCCGMHTIGLLLSGDPLIQNYADYTINSLKEYNNVLQFINRS